MPDPCGSEHPVSCDGLPGIHPSDRLRFSRLQLRGSAGIAPASLSLPQGKDAPTEGHLKERKTLVREIYWRIGCKSNWPRPLQLPGTCVRTDVSSPTNTRQPFGSSM